MFVLKVCYFSRSSNSGAVNVYIGVNYYQTILKFYLVMKLKLDFIMASKSIFSNIKRFLLLFNDYVFSNIEIRQSICRLEKKNIYIFR